MTRGLPNPVLFLVFNRPEETERVFARIRDQRPGRLFVASDGPRADRPGEAELVVRTREIATRVDWPCEVRTLFREQNLGCGRAVSEAITWFFGQVEEGIILEDDCLPHPDFFPFCATLLARYRNEPRVATIGGTHFLPGQLTHNHSHYASKYFQMWGWASWRRAWDQYDFGLSSLTEEEWIALFRRVHANEIEAGYWREVMRAVRARSVDTWDFQVFFSSWKAGACHLMPGRNLVSNIGYGPTATHTNFDSHMANMPTGPLAVGDDLASLSPDPAVDNLIFYLRFLDSMTHTWWVDQVLCPEQKLGLTRAELARRERQVKMLENELAEKRRQLRDAARALALASRANPA